MHAEQNAKAYRRFAQALNRLFFGVMKMNNRYADFNEKSPNKPLFRELHPKATVPSDATGAVIDFRSSDETVDR